MEQFGLEFHHLGLAVREPTRATLFLKGLGYTIQTRTYDAEQNVNLVMATHTSMPDVEIIWAAGRVGPLDGMLVKHSDGLVYHVCYVASDLDATLQAFKDSGVKCHCMSDPIQAVLFGGRLVSFYNVTGVGLVEIIEGSPTDPIVVTENTLDA